MDVDPNDPYSKIRSDQNKLDENIVCDICLDDEDDDGNEIIVCDLCLVAVHQTCYGSEIIKSVPKGDWFCARCRDLKQNPNKRCTEIQCILCPKIDGALKPVTFGKKGANQTTVWVHPICVNWLPGIWFTNDKNEAIEGQIYENSMLISCTSCKTYQKGAVIQCDYQNCGASKHVRCAAETGWIYHWNDMLDDLQIDDDVLDRPVFCSKCRDRGILKYRIRGMDGLKPAQKSRKKSPQKSKGPQKIV